MFYALRSRYLDTIQKVVGLFGEMVAVELRAQRALTTPDLAYQSSASAPSLRAREATMPKPTMSSMSTDGDAGNVKVVVRVRKFVKRGTIGLRMCPTSTTETPFRN